MDWHKIQVHESGQPGLCFTLTVSFLRKEGQQWAPQKEILDYLLKAGLTARAAESRPQQAAFVAEDGTREGMRGNDQRH